MKKIKNTLKFQILIISRYFAHILILHRIYSAFFIPPCNTKGSLYFLERKSGFGQLVATLRARPRVYLVYLVTSPWHNLATSPRRSRRAMLSALAHARALSPEIRDVWASSGPLWFPLAFLSSRARARTYAGTHARWRTWFYAYRLLRAHRIRSIHGDITYNVKMKRDLDSVSAVFLPFQRKHSLSRARHLRESTVRWIALQRYFLESNTEEMHMWIFNCIYLEYLLIHIFALHIYYIVYC